MVLILELVILYALAFVPALISIKYGLNKYISLALLIVGIIGYVFLFIQVIKKNRLRKKKRIDKYPLLKEFRDNGAKGVYFNRAFIYIDSEKKQILFEEMSKGNYLVDFNQIEEIETFVVQKKKRSLGDYLVLIADAFDERSNYADHLIVNELTFSTKYTYHVRFYLKNQMTLEYTSNNDKMFQRFNNLLKENMLMK